MKISIVMPAHNEEKRISSTLKEYSEYFEVLRKKNKLDYEILVVINNTKDKTAQVVAEWKKKNKKITYINLIKGGKGYAVIEGFKASLKRDFDLIGFVDADGATPPSAFYDLVENINNYDGIIASRYLKGAKLYPKMTFRREVVGRVFHFLVKSMFLMPFQDTQCGAKVFKKEAIELITKKVGMTQWAFDIEMLYELHSNNFKIREIPTTWKEVEGSKLRVVKTSMQMFLSIVQLRLKKSPFNRLLKPLKKPILYIWEELK